MKIVKIANLAITVILASLVASCVKEQPKEEAPETPVKFTVELNSTADAEYAEVVVRHDGLKDATWFGFVTKDVNSPVEDLIKAQLPNVNAKSLHVGNVQTVALRDLEEYVNYRYVAFGVNSDGERYGEPGNLAFCTSPVFDVTFQAQAGEIGSHQASFSVSHDGIDVLTYMAFVTDDVKSDLKAVAAENYASIVGDNGKLNEGVELLKGTSGTVSFDELTHETDYRLVVYGIYDNNGVVISYGTPAEVKFTTPIDLSIVPFSATVSGITTESATATVTYDAKDEELTWYGFVSEDLTSPAATLIAAAVSGLSAEALQTGKNKAIDIKDLTIETDYRFIATGVKDGKAFGVPADVKFSTLSEAYVNCQFTIVASDITPFGATLTITHNGLEDFQYHGFFTEDFDTALADLEIPANADSNLMTGLEKVVEVEDLKPLTKYRYVVVGRYAGNEYGHRGEVVFETADPSVAAPYEEFIGKWIFGDVVLSVSQQEAGSTYTVTGLPGLNKFNSANPKPVTALYQDGKFVLMEQIVGEYNHTSYGKCYDIVCGLFEAESSSGTIMHFVNYPRYATTPSAIFSLYKSVTGGYGVLCGSSDNGILDQIGVRWVIAEGQNKGLGNTYADDLPIPSEVEKAPEASDAYNAWLGTWYIPTNVYQYDSDDKYIGDEVKMLPLTIIEKVPNQSYLISGIGPENESYDVLATFSNGDIVLNAQTVYTWNHSSVGEINERFVGIYGEGDESYYTWSPDLVVCTGKINSNGTSATLTPGKASDGTTDFNGFAFKQCYQQNGQNVAYGYGGDYDLPNTLTRTAGSSVSAITPKPAKAVFTSARGFQAPFRTIEK